MVISVVRGCRPADPPCGPWAARAEHSDTEEAEIEAIVGLKTDLDGFTPLYKVRWAMGEGGAARGSPSDEDEARQWRRSSTAPHDPRSRPR